jgi:SagB-type dehydrogenase family enzyme
VYLYEGEKHELSPHADGDIRKEVASAALGQAFLADAAVILLVVADYSRTTGRYGERGRRYVDMEVGHLGQNVSLEAEALRLATVCVGAFRDRSVAQAFSIDADLEPLYLLPVGHPGD